jgi:two-component system CheB/CheR fusion protein
MRKHQTKSGSTSTLRKQAEETLRHRTTELPEPSAEEMRHLIHELGVHQIELEMQNEQLRQTQQELEAARDGYADLYDFAPVGYFTVGENGLIAQANLTGAALLGMERNALIGKPLSRFIAPRDQNVYYAHHQQVFSTRDRHACDINMVAQDGSPFYAHLESVGLRGRAGHPIQQRTVLSDITERKQAEQELQQSEAMLRQQSEELAEADRLKDEFLATLAHELRSPLTPISHAVKLIGMQSKPMGHELEWEIDVIDRQVKHLIRLVDDLLDVARISRGKIELHKQTSDLTEIIAQAVEVARPLIDDRQHELTISLPPEPVWAEVDPARMVQVVANLLNNAAKYTQQAGQVGLTLKRDGNQTVIAVQDNGVGISPELLSQVFDIFTQADRTLERSQGGLGLGLTLVYRLMALHGGTVQVFSDGPGKGSRFVVSLPALSAVEPRPNHTATVDENRGKSPSRRILIVDDHEDIATSFALLLETMGHLVNTVFDGAAALTAAREFHPQIVFLDIGMPDIDGFEVARRLRNEHRQNLQLIALTGYGQEKVIQKIKDTGFDHHLIKPASYEVVAALLASIPA